MLIHSLTRLIIFISRANERTLESYNVQAGETFNVVLQLRGG